MNYSPNCIYWRQASRVVTAFALFAASVCHPFILPVVSQNPASRPQNASVKKPIPPGLNQSVTVVSGNGEYVSFLGLHDKEFANKRYRLRPNLPLLPGDKVYCLSGAIKVIAYGRNDLLKRETKIATPPHYPENTGADPARYFLRGGLARGDTPLLYSPAQMGDEKISPNEFVLRWRVPKTATDDQKVSFVVRNGVTPIWKGESPLKAKELVVPTLREKLRDLQRTDPEVKLVCLFKAPGVAPQRTVFALLSSAEEKALSEELSQASLWGSPFLRAVMEATAFNHHNAWGRGAEACDKAAQLSNRQDLQDAARRLAESIGSRVAETEPRK